MYLLKEANRRFRSGDYKGSHRLYKKAAQYYGKDIASITFSLDLAEKRALAKGEALDSDKSLLINWVTGGSSSKGWAYENNAKRFAKKLTEYEHFFDDRGRCEVAVYFDVLIGVKQKSEANIEIVRVGGPMPLDRLYGKDKMFMREDLSRYHTVVALNNKLKNSLAKYHPNVIVIPNGVDLKHFSPDYLKNGKEKNRPFTVGFCASVKNSQERDLKGLDIAEKACNINSVRFLSVGKGAGQKKIPHDQIVEEFYSQIDVLVHPVKDGKEGSSNVIMEALALGIPVITTKFAGYHAEYCINRGNIFFCNRDPAEIAKVIEELKYNSLLYMKISTGARRFAVKHHDIEKVTCQYKKIIEEAIEFSRAEKKISLIPFWLPIERSASSRIRSLNIKEAINAKRGDVKAINFYSDDSDVIVITQCCDDYTLQLLKKSKKEKKKIIYDVCDRLFDSPKSYPGLDGGLINTKKRFFDLVKVADHILVPTHKLKDEVERLKLRKKVHVIPDSIDYVQKPLGIKCVNKNIVAWFGNVGRGNFDSSQWILDYLVEEKGFHPIIITNKNAMKKYPKYFPYTIEWDYHTFVDILRSSCFSVLSHSDEEKSKSPNRLVSSFACGVPAISYNSQSMSRLLSEAGIPEGIIHSYDDIDRILEIFCIEVKRESYLVKGQSSIIKAFGRDAIAERYIELLF